MAYLSKFLSLPVADQHLLVKTLFLLGAVTLGLRVLPFQNLRRILAQWAQAPAHSTQASQPAVGRIAWAVRLASRSVPLASCLPQALVMHMLLRRWGYPAEFFIGVVKSRPGQLQAHAWVESDGKVVIGDLPDLPRYTPLLSLESHHEAAQPPEAENGLQPSAVGLCPGEGCGQRSTIQEIERV